MPIKFAVSEASSPPVSQIALDTDSLSTCEISIIILLHCYVLYVYHTYLCCKIHSHLRKRIEGNVFELDLGYHPYSLTGSCVSLIELFQMVPQNMFSIALHIYIINTCSIVCILSKNVLTYPQ